VIRAVLDTNVLISALLFEGLPSRLVPAWRSSSFRPALSPSILAEYLRVLAYPKFHLTPDDIQGLLEEEILPFFETVRVRSSPTKVGRDPDDAKFVACALEASVPWIVSGDSDLLDLGRVESVRIVTPREFLSQLKRTR
jgi:putative PIN family toxin of toxin-antitoxin system